jgi:hypothetical protein
MYYYRLQINWEFKQKNLDNACYCCLVTMPSPVAYMPFYPSHETVGLRNPVYEDGGSVRPEILVPIYQFIRCHHEAAFFKMLATL